MLRLKTLARSVRGLLGLILLSACGSDEAQREALELALTAAEAGVLEAQLALSRYDGTAEIEELAEEGEADERAVAAGDLPPSEFEQRRAAREVRIAGLLAAQQNLDVRQDSVWLRMATVLDSTRRVRREAARALDLFLFERQD